MSGAQNSNFLVLLESFNTQPKNLHARRSQRSWQISGMHLPCIRKRGRYRKRYQERCLVNSAELLLVIMAVWWIHSWLDLFSNRTLINKTERITPRLDAPETKREIPLKNMKSFFYLDNLKPAVPQASHSISMGSMITIDDLLKDQDVRAKYHQK